MLYLVLLVFAFVFAIIAALVRVRTDVPSLLGWVHWGWLSFAFYLAALIFGPAGPASRLGRLSGAMPPSVAAADRPLTLEDLGTVITTMPPSYEPPKR